jgi:hypothetical protein
MADDTIIHRTLWDVTKLARPGYDQPDPLFGLQHKPRRPLQGSLSGYQMIGSALRSVDLLKKPYQDFSKYATVWERNWSTLVDNPDGINSFDPVVGPNDQFSLGYSVVGHIGTVDGSQILVPRGYGGGGKPSLSQILDKGVPAFVSEYTHVWTSTGDWEVFGATEERFTVLTGVDGTIVMLVAYDVVGLVGEDPIMDIIVGKVLTDLGTYAVKKLIGSLVRRVWGPIVAAETRLKLLKEALARMEGAAASDQGAASEAAALLNKTPAPRPGSRVLLVGPETKPEFQWALDVTARGGKATAVNPLKTAAANDFISKGGTFVQGTVESLPRDAAFDIIREDFPYPTGKFIDAQMVSARLTRLAPRGAWVVVTESEEFAKALETTAKLRAKVMRREFPAFHEGAPVSVHPKETSRFALIIRS